ncbi:rhodanese-like domain-containing protein [Xanthobacter sp. KR7-225]|uniref:rhodanese-like domain-containing protein n=1 Tax=Xanthobacter sp. KR7-225 TaxID=3156613 RepID=UPI0032B4BADD
MTGKLKMGVKELLEEARATITEIEPQEAIALAADPQWLVVDIRDVRERQREGYIPGSFHAPRGMVEFWIDPESPYFKKEFGDGKKLLFHCALDWRSALTVHTLQRMGVENTAHIKGGFKAWKEAGGPVAIDPPR